jgi:hypothetical protein
MTIIAFEPIKTATDERNVAAILKSWSIEHIRLLVEQMEAELRTAALSYLPDGIESHSQPSSV